MKTAWRPFIWTNALKNKTLQSSCWIMSHFNKHSSQLCTCTNGYTSRDFKKTGTRIENQMETGMHFQSFNWCELTPFMEMQSSVQLLTTLLTLVCIIRAAWPPRDIRHQSTGQCPQIDRQGLFYNRRPEPSHSPGVRQAKSTNLCYAIHRNTLWNITII